MRTRAVAAAALLAAVLGGCAQLPENPIPAAVEAADAIAVQTAAQGAMLQVSAYLASNAALPATLAEAGFTPPDLVTVSYTPGAGADFAVCASSGGIAFEGRAGSVTEVAGC